MDMNISYEFHTVVDQNIDVIHCIHLLDDLNVDRLYVVDAEYHFFGMVIERENFHHIFSNSDEWITYLDEAEMITDLTSMMMVEKKVARHHHASEKEMPVIVDGQIKYVIRFKDYKNLEGMNLYHLRYMLNYLRKYKCIYMSSLNNTLLRKFYDIFNVYFNIKFLSDSCIDEIYDNDKIGRASCRERV